MVDNAETRAILTLVCLEGQYLAALEAASRCEPDRSRIELRLELGRRLTIGRFKGLPSHLSLRQGRLPFRAAGHSHCLLTLLGSARRFRHRADTVRVYHTRLLHSLDGDPSLLEAVHLNR